jgi:predicted RNA methylase
VVHACCGSGGNAIGFARQGCRVTAIDVSAERLAEARHNARVYGVERAITFVHGDALRELPQRPAELLFVDPPWGEDYDKRATTCADFPLLTELLSRAPLLRAYAEIWLKLPSSFSTRSVPTAAVRAWFGEAAGDRQRVKFVQLTLKSGDLAAAP